MRYPIGHPGPGRHPQYAKHGGAQGFLISAGIALLALIIVLAAIRVTREDLSGVDPMAAPVG